MSPRRPPVSEIQAMHRALGKCDWCGLPQEERTPIRKQLKLRHAACDYELQVVQNPAAARSAVFDRDRGICAGCGEDYSLMCRFEPERRKEDGTAGTSWAYSADNANAWWAHDWPFCDTISGKGIAGALFTPVRSISMWHVDHKVPLWKVTELPAIRRIEFFKLGNLQTLCDRCHERKSAEETSEREHFRRLGARRDGRKQEKLPW